LLGTAVPELIDGFIPICLAANLVFAENLSCLLCILM
jgi:hypothetical protein